jgi:hypothetical protein
MRPIDLILGQKNESAQGATTETTKPEWKTAKVYLYREDGRYPAPRWAETPQQFSDMVPDIRRHIDNKLEVRVTNGDDHLLFHSTKNGVEWDGIGLSRFLEHDRGAHEAGKRNTPDTSYDR